MCYEAGTYIMLDPKVNSLGAVRESHFRLFSVTWSWRSASLFVVWFIGTLITVFIMKQQIYWAAIALGSKVAQAVIPPRLRFQNDGTFHISIFEDLHFGEGEDNRTYQCQK